MAGTSEIRQRIAGVRQTQKITHAMYLISSAKLRRAKQELDRTRPYFEALGREIGRIFHVDGSVESRYFASDGTPEAGASACLVITADKGLAGAYNHNVLKRAQERLAGRPDTELYVVGEFGRRWFDQKRIVIEHSFLYTAQNPNLYRAREIARVLLERYDSGAVEAIDIVYTDLSGMNETVRQFQLLPLPRQHFDARHGAAEDGVDFDYQPSLRAVLESVVENYLSGYIYSALVDSFCSEQSARMEAMNAADRNAEELLSTLSKQYNRARQSAITQEITEVSAGARAQRNKKREAEQL